LFKPVRNWKIESVYAIQNIVPLEASHGPLFIPLLRSTSGSMTQTPSISIPKNPTATNSGYYETTPMYLFATQKNTERNRIKQEHIARGENIYCVITGHFLDEYP
jgi:hypothetical protein